MSIRACFESAESLRAWLFDVELLGALRPDFIRIVGPAEQKEFIELPFDAKVASAQTERGALTITGKGFVLTAQTQPYAAIDLWPDGDCDAMDSWLIAAWAEVLGHLSDYQLHWAAAATSDEWHHRNLFKIDYYGTARYSTTSVGYDFRRYVPGLYWMNFLSAEYSERLGICTRSLASELEAVECTLRTGISLQLHSRPSDWMLKSDLVDEFLHLHEQFFSLRRISFDWPSSPQMLRQSLRFVGEHWP